MAGRLTCGLAGYWLLYGGLRFRPRHWRAFGGQGMPHQNSREQQIAVAERTLAAQGWGAWPSCSRAMGLRGYAAEPEQERAAAPVTAPAPAAGAGTYTVVAGDALSKIAAAHGTSWQALYERNSDVLGDPDVLRIGHALDV